MSFLRLAWDRRPRAQQPPFPSRKERISRPRAEVNISKSSRSGCRRRLLGHERHLQVTDDPVDDRVLGRDATTLILPPHRGQIGGYASLIFRIISAQPLEGPGLGSSSIIPRATGPWLAFLTFPRWALA